MVARNPIPALRSSPGGARLLDVLAQTPGAWIVGGAVRDALLGRTPRELDVVVEGDADALVDKLGGEAVRHERFGTATVTVDGVTYDVARARTETYAAPGALPDVAFASVQEDLERRDFTVNAIAVAPDGALLAVDGALDDLDAGILRVLHDASFRDDPTRLWRLARYAARLGFVPDPHTAELAAAAVAADALATVNGARLGAELRLALSEPDPSRALAGAAALGLLPAWAATPAPGAAEVAAELLPADGRPDLLLLSAWTSRAPAAALRAWLADLEFPLADRDVVVAAASAVDRLTFPPGRSALAAELRAEPVEAVALAAAVQDLARAARNGEAADDVAHRGGAHGEAAEGEAGHGEAADGDGAAGGRRAAHGGRACGAAREWLDDVRHVRLEIGGDDLLAAGVPAGPEVGAALRRALDAKLDGRASGREAELWAALGRPLDSSR